MACVALAVRDYLTDAPDKIELLTPGQCEFLRWLLDRFTGPRAFTRWIDGLSPELTDRLQQVKYQDLYLTTDDPRDVHGQIDEIINLGDGWAFIACSSRLISTRVKLSVT